MTSKTANSERSTYAVGLGTFLLMRRQRDLCAPFMAGEIIQAHGGFQDAVRPGLEPGAALREISQATADAAIQLGRKAIPGIVIDRIERLEADR